MKFEKFLTTIKDSIKEKKLNLILNWLILEEWKTQGWNWNMWPK
jgi:hypothetical protein